MAKKERLSEAIWDEQRERWCCRVTMEGKRRAFYSSTPGRKGKREAERKADDWLENGTINGNARFGIVWASFVNRERDLRGDKNPTYIQHEQYGRLYILPVLEYKKLDDIKPIDWQNCIDEPFARSLKAGKPLSAKTLKNIRGALSAFRAYCELCDIDLRSLRTLKIPDAAPVGERRILQPNDLALLFAEPKGNQLPHYLHAWRFQVLTGLRPGEVYALRHEDITPDGVITISRSVNIHGKITQGKNRNARRSFLLPERAVQALADQREYLKRAGLISPYVFPNALGHIANDKFVYNAWQRFCKTQGITFCSLYELRHTMVSYSADVPDALLKPMVGHSRSMDTRGVYGHEVQGNRQRTVAMIETAFESALDLDATKDATEY